MNDLIDRQAAIDLFPNDALEWDTNGGYIAPHFARRMIEELPSAQPVRHAKLLNAHPYGECSNCGYLIDIREEFNYCPNCGAKMYEEDDDETD